MIAAVVAISVGIHHYLQPPPATPEAFTEAINSYLRSHQGQFKEQACLRNFPYGTNPVITSAVDGTTNHWLQLLVQAGLYTQPEQLRDGFWPNLRYRLTSKGQASIQGNRLCLAQGLKVATIDNITQPETLVDIVTSRASFHTQLDGKADWVTSEILQQLPGQGGGNSLKLLMMVQDGHWQVMDEQHQQQIRNQVARNSAEEPSGSLMAWLGHLTGSSEPSDDEIWVALSQSFPYLNRESLHFAKQKCWAIGNDSNFHCRILLGNREEQIRLSKSGSTWEVWPE